MYIPYHVRKLLLTNLQEVAPPRLYAELLLISIKNVTYPYQQNLDAIRADTRLWRDQLSMVVYTYDMRQQHISSLLFELVGSGELSEQYQSQQDIVCLFLSHHEGFNTLVKRLTRKKQHATESELLILGVNDMLLNASLRAHQNTV